MTDDMPQQGHIYLTVMSEAFMYNVELTNLFCELLNMENEINCTSVGDYLSQLWQHDGSFT